MYYKVDKNSECHKQLSDLYTKARAAHNAAVQLTKKLGFKQFGTYKHNSYFAGHIEFFGAETNEPIEGFKRVGPRAKNYFAPRANNKSVINQIAEIPTVRYEELNDILGFKEQSVHMTYVFAPAVHPGINDEFLVEIFNGCIFTPLKGMSEITYTEFKSLEKS